MNNATERIFNPRVGDVRLIAVGVGTPQPFPYLGPTYTFVGAIRVTYVDEERIGWETLSLFGKVLYTETERHRKTYAQWKRLMEKYRIHV